MGEEQRRPRVSYVIGPDGRLTRVWKRATAANNGEVVLKALREAGERAGAT